MKLWLVTYKVGPEWNERALVVAATSERARQLASDRAHRLRHSNPHSFAAVEPDLEALADRAFGDVIDLWAAIEMKK